MMTYLTPFERTGYDLFRSMRDWENEFFGGKSAAMSSCKTDIRDTGDSYVLEAELPGFQKDEIKIGVEGDTLTLSAVHKEKTEEEKAKDGTYLRRTPEPRFDCQQFLLEEAVRQAPSPETAGEAAPASGGLRQRLRQLFRRT